MTLFVRCPSSPRQIVHHPAQGRPRRYLHRTLQWKAAATSSLVQTALQLLRGLQAVKTIMDQRQYYNPYTGKRYRRDPHDTCNLCDC